eukprot:13396150-Heterocapsa_arctica.AAC.1
MICFPSTSICTPACCAGPRPHVCGLGIGYENYVYGAWGREYVYYAPWGYRMARPCSPSVGAGPTASCNPSWLH